MMFKKLHNVPRHLIGEERQLISILKTVLTQRLGETSLVVSNGMPSKAIDQSFFEYAANPDLCIYRYHHSGAIITGDVNISKIDGIIVA